MSHSPSYTPMEMLAMILSIVKTPKDEVMQAEGLDEGDMARIKLALMVERLEARLVARRMPSAMFRAIVEGWTLEDIVREVF